MEPEYIKVTMDVLGKGRMTVQYDIMLSYDLEVLAQTIYADSDNEWARGIIFGSHEEDKCIVIENGQELDITEQIKEVIYQSALTAELMNDE